MLKAPLFITGTPRIVRFFGPMETALLNNRKLDDLSNKIRFNSKPKKKVLQSKRKKDTLSTVQLDSPKRSANILNTPTQNDLSCFSKKQEPKNILFTNRPQTSLKCCQNNFLSVDPRSHHVHGFIERPLKFDKSKGSLSNMSIETICFYNQSSTWCFKENVGKIT